MLNKIMLIGNLGRDPEMSYTEGGTAVTKYTVAVSRRWNDKQSGEKKEETTWFNIVAFDRLAETCNTYLRKGSKVYLEGRMMSRKYTDPKDNVEKWFWEVRLSDMQMLDTKDSRAGAPAGAGGSGLDDVTPDDIPF